MREYRFKTPAGTWVMIDAEEGFLKVSYQPEVRRIGMRVEVLDYAGIVLDVYELQHSFPESSVIEVATIEVEDSYRAARWVATHLAEGMISLGEVTDLVDGDGCHPLNGAYYHIDGIGGQLLMQPEAVLYTDHGEAIGLGDEDLARLEPLGAEVHSIAREGRLT
jgi:hypothetical protein